MNLLRALALMGAAAVMMCSAPVAGTSSTTPAPSASPTAAAAHGAQDFTTVVRNVAPSIVLIESSSGLGSGVVYDQSGDIVTNAHVAGTSGTFTVTTADGKRYSATLLGAYQPSDVAVIKVAASGLKPATFGDSSKLEVGEQVLAMGNPLGYQSSVTDGIVSGLGRTVSEPDGAVLTNVVQTSAAINPGNSGGGLVNLESQVVGVPTLVAVDPQIGGAAPGIGFALPSNTVTDYANQIIKNGKVVNTNRAYLGVQVGDVTSGGAIVLKLAPGAPAESAGVHVGDIITAVNGHAVANASALQAAIANMSPGSAASLTIDRNGQTVTVDVTLGTLPAA
ncbi:MAG TPA: trypsin-like peptidase domain-containing protein [Candidatus Dormibacteraeota bacterium]|nr:trypsin-like peptidase domain-containing protein [Candidatus Dormibacteraeota bacterium]